MGDFGGFGGFGGMFGGMFGGGQQQEQIRKESDLLITNTLIN
jgi:hypothetical protein